MNKSLSIIELQAKRSLWKVLAGLAVIAAGEYFWARHLLLNDKVVGAQTEYAYTVSYSLGSLSRTFCLCYCAALVLILYILTGGVSKKSAVGYRLDMLGVSGRKWMILNSIYDAGCYFLAWAVTAAMILAAAELYKTLPKYAGGAQSIFLEIYRSGNLTYFLPEGFVTRLLAMAGITLSLGVMTAADSRKAADGSFPVATGVAILVVVFFLCSSVPNRLNLLGLDHLATAAIVIFFIALVRFISIMTEPSQKGVSQEADDGE